MMFDFLSNIKRKLVVGVAFVLFIPTAIAHNSRIYTIAMLREIHTEIIFIRSCLTVRFLIIEVMARLPDSLLLVRQS